MRLPVKKAMKIVPMPTPTKAPKKVSDNITALETKMRSLIVLTSFTLTLKYNAISLTKASKGIKGIIDFMNRAAPKLMSTQPVKK